MFEGPLRYIVVLVLAIIVLRIVLRYGYSKADEQRQAEILADESKNSDSESFSVELEENLEEEIETDE